MQNVREVTSRKESIQKLLAPDALNLPERPKVAAIEVEEDIDSVGEEALRVFVVLEESEADEMRRWKSVAPIHRTIHQTLLSHGIRLWPYIRFVKESERVSQEHL